MPDPEKRVVIILKDALINDAVDMKAATEIICSRNPSQLQQLKKLYRELHGVDLDHHIRAHTSGYHGQVKSVY